MQPTRLAGHVRALDGVRAFAVTIVLISHAFPQYRFPGGVGVDVFFVLSGYLITTLLVQERERFGSVRVGAFYLRRLLRLYPALLVLLAVALTFGSLTAGSIGSYVRHAAAAAAYISNLVMGYGSRYLDPLSHTWSLGQEEQFYLLWPAILLGLLAVTTRRNIRVLLLVGALASWVGFVRERTDPFAGFRPDLRCGGLLIGCAVALRLNESTPGWLTRRGTAWIAAAGMVVVLAGGWVVGAAWFPLAVIGTVIVAALLIGSVVVAPETAVGRALAVGPVAYLGRISYSVYLWHYPIILTLQRRSGWSTYRLFVPELLLTLAAAVASHHLVERPALRLKRRFEPAAVRGPEGVAAPTPQLQREGRRSSSTSARQ